MTFDNIHTIKLLQNLLKDPNNSSDSEDEITSSTGIQKFGPGHINKQPSKNVKCQEKSGDITCNTTQNANNITKLNESTPKSIEEWEEMQEKCDDDLLETRTRPNFKISYKQAVRTEDVYLQMANKTSATSSCEEMIIDIDLPDEMDSVDRMDLSVNEQSIDLKTSKYRLKLSLPQPVDPQKGKAKWNSDSKKFVLCLVLNREFDFVNF